MRFQTRLLACACLAGLASGCATFGTNVEGDFTCRAPKGDCAPAHVIDAKATDNLSNGTLLHADARQRSGVVDADTSRTAERTLRVVFPAHVDEAGTLHDEAVAWTVVENPRCGDGVPTLSAHDVVMLGFEPEMAAEIDSGRADGRRRR